MIFQHPTTHHKVRINRKDHTTWATLVKDGYINVTPPHSARKQELNTAFVQLGTLARTKACLTMSLTQCRHMMTQHQQQRLIDAQSVLDSLYKDVLAKFHSKSKQDPEGG